MSNEVPDDDPERKLRRVRYSHWTGMNGHWEPRENSLLAFAYDAHLGSCGVFPPLHILNAALLHGGGGGGMGPGHKWEPFSISPLEYRDLVEAIRAAPPESLPNGAGLYQVAYFFDPDFDGDPATYPVAPDLRKIKHVLRAIPPDYMPRVLWGSAVAAKHRESYHARLRQAGFLVE